MSDMHLAGTMEALRVDQLAAEVLTALAGANAPAILLKGATTARWLYDDGAPRAYGDVDILIGPHQAEHVGKVLNSLGFCSLTAGAGLPDLDHADNWMRRANEFVDLHFTLPSAGEVSPSHLWGQLAQHQETWTVAGASVQVLDWEARAVVVVLHALHHGPQGGTPVEDLRRLLARLSQEEWDQVTALALRLGVQKEFGVGLRILPSGADLASSMDLPHASTTSLMLKSQGVFNAAHSIDRFVRAGSLLRSLRMALAELFPRPQGLRRLSLLANRGPWGLAAAYAQRPFVIVARAPGGLRAWRRARRQLRETTASEV